MEKDGRPRAYMYASGDLSDLSPDPGWLASWLAGSLRGVGVE